MKRVKCFFVGHDYSWDRYKEYYFCSCCGKIVSSYKYADERGLIDRRFRGAATVIKIILGILGVLVAIVAVSFVLSLLLTPILYYRCAQSAGVMGYDYMYDLISGCFVKHPEFGLVPYDKLFILLGGK